jgi:hypothetical protein
VSGAYNAIVVANDSHTHDTRYYTETESDARFLGISANAASATKLATSRTISLTGDVTGSASFDGTANASITATVADNSHNHSSSSGNFTVNGNLNATGNIQKNGTSIYGLGVAQVTVSATSSFAYYLLDMPLGVNIYNLVAISPVEGNNNRLHIAEVALGNWAGIQNFSQILIYCRLGNGVHLEPYYINFYYRI